MYADTEITVALQLVTLAVVVLGFAYLARKLRHRHPPRPDTNTGDAVTGRINLGEPKD